MFTLFAELIKIRHFEARSALDTSTVDTSSYHINEKYWEDIHQPLATTEMQKKTHLGNKNTWANKNETLVALTTRVVLLRSQGLATQIHVGLCIGCRCIASTCVAGHLSLDLSSHSVERLLHVRRRQSRSLQERNVQGLGKLLGGGVLHYLLVRQVSLVTNQQLHDATGGITVNLL